MTSCNAFRSALERALAGRRAQVGSLGWHQHLLGCAACRELLESEQALEALLASLPAPRLEPGVAARVLARLASERALPAGAQLPEAELDRLLAIDVAAPRDLAGRVLGGLAAERNAAALDGLLARWTLPAAPVGLAARTLRALRPERRAAPRRIAPTLARLAAGLLIAAGVGLGLREWLRASPQDGAPREVELVGTPPPAELLATLELLEAWDLLTDTSFEVALTSLDEADAILLELERGSDPLADEAPEQPPQPPSKG